jgi:phosphotriesterase-related protein
MSAIIGGSEQGMMAMTVRGPIPPDALGFTLPHEHLLFNESNWMGDGDEAAKRARAPLPVTLSSLGELHRNRNASLVNLQSNEEIAMGELGFFRDAGGSTVVDVSPPDLNRNVEGLKRLSDVSGVNIIAATGHYCAFVHPPEVAGQSLDELAQWMVKEITEGIGETGIRAGVIGELGITPGGGHPDEWKVIRAAAFAQTVTRATISIHNALPHERQGMRALRVLKEAGADLERVVMGHMTQSTPDLEYHRRIADTGAVLEFDKFGTEFYYDESGGAKDVLHPWPRDADVVLHITELVRLGYADQILLSHDAARRISLRAFGGLGLSHVPGRVVRYLRMAGVTDEEVSRMTVKTPARLFTIMP